MSRLLPLLLALCAVAACHARQPSPAPAERAAQVRYRYGVPPDQAGERLLDRVPQARWDMALLAATRELAASATQPGARLTPASTALATARAGFPGDARFARLYNGGAFPDELVADVEAAMGAADNLDVALARRAFGDGTALWVLGMAPHWGELDPIPRDLALDDPLPLGVELPGSPDLALFIASPAGPVTVIGLGNKRVRWVDCFHVPGEYRLEIVNRRDRANRVIHKFSIFVEHEPQPASPLPEGIPQADPASATEWLYQSLNARRMEVGLPPLLRFERFEPLVREHAAFMAASGVVDHAIPGVTRGVQANAWQQFHPRAAHHQDLAAAFSPEEALELVWNSPGHRQNLLCESCTHATIGVALEPVARGPARLFVVWELLSFPHGPPRAIERPQ